MGGRSSIITLEGPVGDDVQGDLTLSAGTHEVKVEYYEREVSRSPR
jgi:hypothetical protein